MFTGVFKSSPRKPLAPSLAREKLAQLLASKPLRGHSFVPQGRVGPFIVDFLCREAGLVIELTRSKVPPHSASRTEFLARMGYRVLQVAPGELHTPHKLVRLILSAIET
jgi:very-short-patch-repair endonuclease